MPFLPSPRVVREADGTFRLERAGERPTSIGRLRSFVGNTGVLVRAYAYIRAHGGTGLREVSDDAVLAANYLKHRLAGTYDIPYDRPCKHEFVASAATIKKRTGVRTSTSPSASSTTATTRRRSTSRSSSRRGC